MLIPKIINLYKSENGATAIEYALIATLIGMACVISLSLLGNDISNLFSNISPYIAS